MMGTSSVSSNKMRRPEQIPSKQSLEVTPIGIHHTSCDEYSFLMNVSSTTNSHTDGQLQRTQELRTGQMFTSTSSSDLHVDDRLNAAPTGDGDTTGHTSQHSSRSVTSRTTPPHFLMDGHFCNTNFSSTDSYSSHDGSITNSLIEETNTANIVNKDNIVRGMRSKHTAKGVTNVASSAPWGTAMSLLWMLLVLVTNEHGGGVLLADARTTSSVPSTTTSRTNIRGYTSQQVDYPPELRPRVPDEPLHQYRIFLQRGQSSEDELPVCSPYAVCNKISTYSTPYAVRLCRCPDEQECSTSLDVLDGHTIVNKDVQFKVCEPVKKLPQCKLFTEVSYTMIFYPDNVTQLVTHCVCPKNAVTYIVHKDPYRTNHGYGYFYSFACSPLELECKRKEPCRLFSARKKTHFEEVTTTILCRCPSNRSCPAHHTDHGVVPGKVYTEDIVRTYSGYCV